ncbi:hypothetical protein [Prochlorococcus sp. MIT 1341]|uniref:hypothetical protein n=1 Tax=Prochlorococcus sp. MIT 1341 TaxID=3096221 RepID=UPI002A7631EC|nr:hypothetical protein [Prochlorococcus sp. MIT 1341]
MNTEELTVPQKVKILVQSLDGVEQTNEALSRCSDSEAMINVLLSASEKLELDLTKADLIKTAPIRDWIWYKDGGALVQVGDGVPRYQQDKNSANLRYIGGGLVIALLFIVGMLTGF